MDVGSINGNMGFFDKKNVTGLQKADKPNQLLFEGLSNKKVDDVQFNMTPGNTGVSESTARGVLRQVDEIANIGF